MDRVRVVAPQGATLRGPARVALTPDQHRRRSAVLGPLSKKGLYDLTEADGITLKHGEEFGLEKPEARLNASLFEVIAAAKKGGKSKPDVAGADEPEGDGDADAGADADADGAAA